MSGHPSLPSACTAYALVSGDASSLPKLARDILGRAAIIGVGVRIVGAEFKDAAKYGLAGSMAIEAFVLAHAALMTKLKTMRA
jgi:hypothetical protein